MRTSAEIVAEQARGKKIAERLAAVGTYVRLQGEDVVRKTRSVPWCLGHGDWVVSVEGKAGGQTCSMMEILTEQEAKRVAKANCAAMAGTIYRLIREFPEDVANDLLSDPEFYHKEPVAMILSFKLGISEKESEVPA